MTADLNCALEHTALRCLCLEITSSSRSFTLSVDPPLAIPLGDHDRRGVDRHRGNDGMIEAVDNTKPRVTLTPTPPESTTATKILGPGPSARSRRVAHRGRDGWKRRAALHKLLVRDRRRRGAGSEFDELGHGRRRPNSSSQPDNFEHPAFGSRSVAGSAIDLQALRADPASQPAGFRETRAYRDTAALRGDRPRFGCELGRQPGGGGTARWENPESSAVGLPLD